MEISSDFLKCTLSSTDVNSRPRSDKKNKMSKGTSVVKSIPSERVIIPRAITRDGEVHFNRDFAPGGCRAVTPKCKKYIPDKKGNFFCEVEKALKEDVKLVTCLVDINSNEHSYLLSVIKLVDFCNHYSIPVVDFQLETDVALGRKTKTLIRDHFLPSTKTLVKPTCSIFSTPETHEMLFEFMPDALIFAGELAEICVHASVHGFSENYQYASGYGVEYGALEYGFPVYMHKEFVLGNLISDVRKEGYFCFSTLE